MFLTKFRHYTQVLKTLFAILNKEGNPRVIDNVCAATCRMISTHKSALPLEQVCMKVYFVKY